MQVCESCFHFKVCRIGGLPYLGCDDYYNVVDENQKLAADILAHFSFIKDMKDYKEVYDIVKRKFDLREDKLTGVPLTKKEFEENKDVL